MTNDNKPFEKAQRENPLTDEEIMNDLWISATFSPHEGEENYKKTEVLKAITLARASDADAPRFRLNSTSDVSYAKMCWLKHGAVVEYCHKCLEEKERLIAEEIFRELDKNLRNEYCGEESDRASWFQMSEENYLAIKRKYLPTDKTE